MASGFCRTQAHTARCSGNQMKFCSMLAHSLQSLQQSPQFAWWCGADGMADKSGTGGMKPMAGMLWPSSHIHLSRPLCGAAMPVHMPWQNHRPANEGPEAAMGHLGPHNSSDAQNAGQLTWKPLQQLPNIARRLKSRLQSHMTQSKAPSLLVTVSTCFLEQFSAAN